MLCHREPNNCNKKVIDDNIPQQWSLSSKNESSCFQNVQLGHISRQSELNIFLDVIGKTRQLWSSVFI